MKEAFKERPIYIKIIGLGELENEDAKQYNTVVMLNKCMAWQMDRKVIEFLKRYEDHGNMIVLTTSGDGDWLPKMEGRNFDAISSASEQANIDEVAELVRADRRVSAYGTSKFGQPFGGKCLPSNLDQLISAFRSQGLNPLLFEAIKKYNLRLKK